MANSVQALRALQEIDKDLFRVNSEIKRLPEERDRRQEKLDRAQEVLEEKRQAILVHKVRIKELDDTVTVQRQRITKLEKESMSNRDMTVVEACRYEVRGLKRQIDEAEREELGYMESIERTNFEIEEIDKRLKAELEVFAEFCKNVDSELATAQTRQGDLTARRELKMDKDLDRNTLDLYERLLIARNGEALATLDGGVCQSCFMRVPPNLVVRLARGNAVIQCSSCDRIMYQR
ncbi:MAG: putative nucleic acid-binding Zn-ribbon protein [Planctomycetota bacterium]|jgi:predicted  nucleic acid-binding Zn-ribbon protein